MKPPSMLEATRSLVQGCKATWKKWPPPLQDALIHCIGGENATINPLVIENRLHDLDKDSDRLLTMDGSENVDLRIKQISDEMLQLKQMKKNVQKWLPSRIWAEKTKPRKSWNSSPQKISTLRSIPTLWCTG